MSAEPSGVELGDDVLHVPGREKLPLLDIDRPPGLRPRRPEDRSGGRGRREFARRRPLPRPARTGSLSCTSVMTGKPERLADFGEDRQRRLQSDPARGRARGPIGLVEGRLEDEADGAPRRDLLQRCSHLERVGPALELAGSGDQRERQRGAEPGRERPLADLNDGVVAQRNVPLSPRLLASSRAVWQRPDLSSSRNSLLGRPNGEFSGEWTASAKGLHWRKVLKPMSAETKYAHSGDVMVACQVIGHGPLDLLIVPGFISHIEQAWEDPSYAHFLQQLSSFSRLILFDKRGTGISERTVEVGTLARAAHGRRARRNGRGGFEMCALAWGI